MMQTKLTMKLLGACAIGSALLLTGCEVGDGSGTDTSAGAVEYPTKKINILAPGSTGGGWDTRARAIQSGLGECDVTDQSVSVTNVPGAGGTIGLSEFVDHTADPYNLMVMDTVTMLGGIVRNDSPYDLAELTPIAGLTIARTAVVVPADSPMKSMDDLRKAFKDDPKAVSWAGGSLGGPDHLMAALLAKHDGVDVSDLNYVATGGGGEVVSLLLSGSAKVAVSTYTELASQIDAGDIRPLAVTGTERKDGLDAPTLEELDLGDIDSASTGGILAPPEVSDEDADAVAAMVEKLHGTNCWSEALEKNAWEDALSSREEFAATIAEDKGKVEEILDELELKE